MSRADYLGKQFFKIAQLTNSSICYKNTFLSPRSSVRIQLTIALHLPNLKLFVTSCHKYVGSASPFLSVSPWKAGNLNQKVYSHLWQGSWRLALDWKKTPDVIYYRSCRNNPFFSSSCAFLFQAGLAYVCPHGCTGVLRSRDKGQEFLEVLVHTDEMPTRQRWCEMHCID